MSADAAPSKETIARQEATFIEALEQRPIPVDTLVGVLRFLRSTGAGESADNCTQMLEDALVEAGDRDGLLRLLRFRSVGRDNDRAFGIVCRDLLRETWKDRDAAAYLEACGFGEQPPLESLRRLELLLASQPGTFCLDRTWGFGVLKKADAFYRKFTIDFTSKPNHQIAFQHAAEALVHVDGDHLLARSHTNPQAIAQLVREQPEEIVRLALRSFGGMSVARLEHVLVEQRIVGGGDWKRFWDAARKALKNDPLVEIPAKRTEPIVLHAQARDYGDAWLDVFSRERDLARIVSGVESFVDAAGGSVSDMARPILADRLAFAVTGARNTDPALYARLAALISRTGIDAVPLADLRAHLWEDDRFIRACEKLIARDVARLVAVLRTEPDGAARLLAALETMPFNLLDATLEALREGVDAPAAQARCRELLLAPSAPPTLVVWIFRNRATLTDWPLPGLAELLAHAILLIERTVSGESLRMQNTMRQLFENAKWFEGILRELDEAGRRALFDRLQASAAFDPATQRTLLGRLLKFDPALAQRKRSSDGAARAAPVQRLTSWRSLAEHQLQYKKLIEVDLPKSSQDIAVARSYGDLRENFEYHAAKHAQTLLLQRQAELDQELQQVRGTDFAGASMETVGMGVCVTLAHADGRRRRFSILGEWDRDEALGIISCKSRMSQCLDGRKVGDAVQVPGEQGDETATIAAIEPLDEAVQAWIRVTPAEAAAQSAV